MSCQAVIRSIAVAAGLVLTACAGPSPTPGPPSPAVAAPEPSPTARPPALPGEPLDLYPYQGAGLAVVGVAAADTLSLRSGPGTEFDVLAELAPLTDGLRATGHNRSLPDGSWWVEVQAAGRTGWVNARFVAQPGRVTDVTAELGRPVRAASMIELATAVVAARGPAGDRPEATVVDGPRAGDLYEVVVDVLGLADDAQTGERLHLFAVHDGADYALRTVEATVLCVRGVSPDGACV
ncbi:MAG TPA: SH3 domain-containing protein [Pseudonocardia sp.]|nr:SH3 domain-containing protein [Pseudonocardia sp.]